MKGVNAGGFLVLEVLIAGLILTASIASAMILFKTGFERLEKINEVNLLSSKLLQAGSELKVIELDRQNGTEDIGDGVTMKWQARLAARDKSAAARSSPASATATRGNLLHDLFLYRVDFDLEYKGLVRDYHVYVFRSRPLSTR